MKKSSFITQTKKWAIDHKIWSSIIVIIILLGGYYIYKKASAANVVPQYVLSPAHLGTITQTVTGSGQVSAENQLDVTSEVSGKIQAIHVTVGQHVYRGDVLATLDAHDALINLENARIAYQKLVAPAKTGDITNARNSVDKAYTDAFNAIASTYLDLPTIMAGFKDMYYTRDGYFSDQKSSYLISTARTYRDATGVSYDKAVAHYESSLELYKTLSRTSATSSIEKLLDETYTTAKLISTALQQLQNTVTYVMVNQPEYNSSLSSAAQTNVTTWSNQVISDLTSIVSAQNAIASNNNSLNVLLAGADSLDIRSQQLSLLQAEETYAKYTIRAPFDGIVGRIPVSVYGQASVSTVISTLIGDRKIANISLNEVDAAKVKPGQHVAITFDAIDGLNATGTVDHVDLVGTVSQGVVSYTVQVIIELIKPGMSINISIVTNEKTGVLIVPSSALKTQGTKKYVEVLAGAASASTTRLGIPSNASSTYQRIRTSTTTPQYSGSTSQNRTMTIASATAPTKVFVTIGDADDTNTEITNGLERGQLVVTRTITAGTATTATPNILSSLGGNRGSAGANRAIVRPAN